MSSSSGEQASQVNLYSTSNCQPVRCCSASMGFKPSREQKWHQSKMCISNNVFFRKISILPPRRVFLVWTPHPSRNSSLGSYIPLKIWPLIAPLPLGISNDPLWWGYGYFLEPHNYVFLMFSSRHFNFLPSQHFGSDWNPRLGVIWFWCFEGFFLQVSGFPPKTNSHYYENTCSFR